MYNFQLLLSVYICFPTTVTVHAHAIVTCWTGHWSPNIASWFNLLNRQLSNYIGASITWVDVRPLPTYIAQRAGRRLKFSLQGSVSVQQGSPKCSTWINKCSTCNFWLYWENYFLSFLLRKQNGWAEFASDFILYHPQSVRISRKQFPKQVSRLLNLRFKISKWKRSMRSMLRFS